MCVYIYIYIYLTWKEREMKFARFARTSLSETVATTTSTSSSPSNCEPCAQQENVQGEEPLDTGGGRVFLPRCLFWSSGHC